MHRFHEVARLHRLGLSSRKIARILKIGRNTLRSHLSALRAAGLLDVTSEATARPDILNIAPIRKEAELRLNSKRRSNSTRVRSITSELQSDTRVLTLPGSARRTVEALALTHGLSPKETAVVLLAVSGLDGNESAELLACKRSTLGTHWARVFGKTGIRSQRDLFASMLRQDPAHLCPVARNESVTFAVSRVMDPNLYEVDGQDMEPRRS
jgi:DNA-binding CsgD family transcriptional regulator